MFGSDIIIQGGPFDPAVKLKGILAKRMNIVYGRNGSGKSTIAKAFQEQQTTGMRTPAGRDYQLSFDGSGSFTPDVQSRLFVFNEQFIDSSVKFSDRGLKSIVRIGASAELDGPIKEAKERIKTLEKERAPFAAEQAMLDGGKDGSTAEADKKLKDGLKSGGYGDRYLDLEGKKLYLNAAALDLILNAPIPSAKSFSIADAAAKFREGIGRYRTYQDGFMIAWQAPDMSVLPDLDRVNALLEQSVRPATLTALEKEILDDLSTALASEDLISKTYDWIVHDGREYCPLCHQPVSDKHRELLKERLLRFRDQRVEDFKAEVAFVRDEIRYSYNPLPTVPGAEAEIAFCLSAQEELRACLSEIYDALNKKYANPFSPIPPIDKNKFAWLVSRCEDASKKVSDAVDAYNTALQEKDQLLKQLRQESVTLAVQENFHWIVEYKRRMARKEEVDKELARIDNEISRQKAEVDRLIGQMDQIDEAREQINLYLDIIFGNRKLRLTNAGRDSYHLELRQEDSSYVTIPTKFISSGERNALALAYFFACVLEKKEKDYQYNEPTMLVIDDPVTSFDADNKAGVLSLLALQCGKVLRGNDASKVLVLTHDMGTLRELCSQRATLFPDDDFQTGKFLRLCPKRKLKELPCNVIRDNMEYYNDLQEIYRFAEADDPEEYAGGDSMGNTLRRFAETYATRWYKCSWLDLFSDADLLNRLPRELRDKIKAFAIRPVLNSQSHGGDPTFDIAEVQRAARVILVYLYYASWDHLHAFLVGRKGNEDRMRKIESWGEGF